jgi:hypothetical protein
MPRRVGPSKYAPLTTYLAGLTVATVRLMLLEIEAIIDAPLPVSAWSSAFLSNSGETSQARAWRRVGWRTTREARRQWVDAVTFVRVASGTDASPVASLLSLLPENACQRRRGDHPIGDG